MQQQITVLLLLGSYDLQTKSYLENVKEELVKAFSGENVYAFLLDRVEIYCAEQVQVLAEIIDKRKVTLFVFQENTLTEVYDVNLRVNLDKTVYSFLEEKYGVLKVNKLSVFDKFDLLMRLAKVIFLIRDKEETRGGEYVELMHALFRGHFAKLWFFKREGIQLSAMLMEYLDKFKVNMRPYSNSQDLQTQIIRLLKYELSNE